MQIIAEKDDGANGHISLFRSAQVVKILPQPMPKVACFAINEVSIC
jgi:hypothetical protein